MQPGSPSSQPSLSRYLLSIGFGSWFLFAVNVLIFLAMKASDFEYWTRLLMLCPAWVFQDEPQLYRLASSAFVHGSVTHIAMNALATLTIGNILERTLGTAAFLSLSVVSVLVVGPMYVLLSYVYTSLPLTNSEQQCAVGYSGVLFVYIFLMCAYSTKDRQLLCLKMKSWYYPWVLLIFTQVILPNVSFLGHLSGILVGVLFRFRLLGALLPSASWIEAMDNLPVSKWAQERLRWTAIPTGKRMLEILSCRFCGSDSNSVLGFQRYPPSNSLELSEI